MTDPINRRFTTPTGRIHWLDPMTDEFREKLTQARDRTWRGSFTAKIDNPPHVQAAFAVAFGYDATPFLVGHDPQKLLPDHRGTEEHRRYAWQQINVSRWNDADSSPLDDIQRWMKTFDKRKPTYEHLVAIVPADIDYAALEKRILASIDDPRVRCIVLDFDGPSGDLFDPRNYQAEMYALGALEHMKQPVETAAGIRDKSYLKHDPSKKHTRRKRR